LTFIWKMWLAAPAETKKAAVAAILVGIGGVAFSLLRSFRLMTASRRLGMVDIGSETAASRWEHVRLAAQLRSFSRMMDRLDRSRRLGSAEPEATWRAAFDLVADGEERYEAIVRSLASVAVLFGLAGTVLGFARLVEPMLAIQQNGAPASLTAELGGAFLATLAGIFGAVLILLFAVPWLRRAEDTWLTAVEDIGRLVLIPSLPRPPTRIQDVVLEELKRRLETVKDGWVEALSEPAKQLAGIATSASSSVDKLASALKGVTPETLNELATSARSMKTSANAMAKSATRYEVASTEVGKVSAELEKALLEFQAVLNANSAKVQAVEKSVTGAQEQVKRTGDAIEGSITSMAGRFADLASTVRDRMAEEAGMFDNAKQTSASINAELQELNKAAKELYDGARNVTLSSAAVKNAVSPLPADLKGALDTWLADFQRRESLLFAQLRERFESLAEVSRNLTAASQRIANLNIAHQEPPPRSEFSSSQRGSGAPNATSGVERALTDVNFPESKSQPSSYRIGDEPSNESSPGLHTETSVSIESKDPSSVDASGAPSESDHQIVSNGIDDRDENTGRMAEGRTNSESSGRAHRVGLEASSPFKETEGEVSVPLSTPASQPADLPNEKQAFEPPRRPGWFRRIVG
jgi:biopolymer transport protein ExbB/TolQ/CII-binding regulator of phage lambda lysogenization HflD